MLGLVLVHWLAKGCGPCWLGDAAQAVVDILASTKGTKWERALFIAASISQFVDSQSIKKQRERGEAVLDVCSQKTTYIILTDWLTNFTKPVWSWTCYCCTEYLSFAFPLKVQVLPICVWFVADCSCLVQDNFDGAPDAPFCWCLPSGASGCKIVFLFRLISLPSSKLYPLSPSKCWFTSFGREVEL